MKVRGLAATSWLPVLLAIAVSTVTVLALYDYWAVREWRRSAIGLANRAAYDSAVLVVTALTRDMRGAQTLVLGSRDAGNFATETPAEASNQVATGEVRLRPTRRSTAARPTRWAVRRHVGGTAAPNARRAHRSRTWKNREKWRTRTCRRAKSRG